MLAALVDGGGGVMQAPPAPPPPTPTLAAPQPVATAAAPSAAATVGGGETLQQAEQTVLGLVARGMTGAAALALHPLPPGTSTADALAFLSELPQTTYAIDSPDGTVTGPPLTPPPLQPEADTESAVGETTLEAYKPPGIVAQWRNLIDVFKVTAPSNSNTISSLFDSPKEFWK